MLQTQDSTKGDKRSCSTPSSSAAGEFSYADHCRLFDVACTKRDSNSGGRIVKFHRSETIYSAGDVPQHLYKVIEGAVRLSRLLMDGRRQIMDILLPGDTFGLETASAHAATAESVGEATLQRCSIGCVSGQLAGSKHAHDVMMATLSRSLSAAQDHLAMLGHQGATERVASFLMHLVKEREGGGEKTIEVPIGRQDMADYLGLTIETTCRSLSTLKSSQIISIPNRRQIVVHRLPALRARAASAA